MIDGRRGRSPSRSGEASVDGSIGTPETSVARGRRPRFALGSRLHRLGVSADQITVLGLFLAGGTAVAIAYGWFVLGTALIIVGGLMDALDGAVAKAAGPTSKRGAFFDSTSDRLADGLIFGGVAWYFARGHHPLLALLPFAILAAGNVVSYERAKAESLGFDAKGGLMERAERLIMLGSLIFFSQFFPLVLIPSLIVLLVLTLFTAGQRFVRVWVQATADLKGIPTEQVAIVRWRTGRVESRWRTWRESAQLGARNGRVATRPSSRGRSRRQMEPLAIRVRRALQTESTRASARSPRSVPKAPRARSQRWANGGGLRKRFDASR